MPVYPSVRDHAVSLCERAGYDVTVRPERSLDGPPALADPTAIEGFRIALDGGRPPAYPADYEYAEGLD